MLLSGIPETFRHEQPGPILFEPEGQEDVYNWLRFTVANHGSPPWTRIGTIRHANLVQLIFQELALLNDGEALRRCLATCFPGEDIRNVAKRLLATIQYSGVCSQKVSMEKPRGWTVLQPE
jgi:hypothetical protein